jgi:hypothetical protein
VLLLFSIIFLPARLFAQQAQKSADSSGISPWGLSRNPAWDRLSWYSKTPAFAGHTIDMKYPSNSYQSYLNRSLVNTKPNPFSIDLRGSSYYVPTMVRDELNLIMNRPRDSAFMPVLGIATWIAYQMASKYLPLQQNHSIGYDELVQAQEALPVLYSLWKKSPQSAGQLYADPDIHSKMIFKQVQNDLKLLQQNNLVKSRMIEADSVVYFPSLDRKQILTILDSACQNPAVAESEKILLQNMHHSVLATD